MSFVRMLQESLSGCYKNACPDNLGTLVRVLQECCPGVARITTEDLDETRKIIEEIYPDYLDAFDKTMKRTTGHRFNMFIMKKSLADDYCKWLFDILFELEKRLDISHYSDNDKRVFGFVSERLLDVWLTSNHIRHKDIPYIFLEKQNWITKIVNFVLRKMNMKQALGA